MFVPLSQFLLQRDVPFYSVSVFFFKQKPAYEMRISDWSSDVFSSDLRAGAKICLAGSGGGHVRQLLDLEPAWRGHDAFFVTEVTALGESLAEHYRRSEEHTSELQSLMRISYAVFCLKKKKKESIPNHIHIKHTET